MIDFKQHFIQQALEESGIGTIQEIKDFYANDIISYYRQTYKKVSKLYEEYKLKKQTERAESVKSNEFFRSGPNSIHSSGNVGSAKNETLEEINFIDNKHHMQMEQFMNENDM
jgi:hypothetical protein